MLCCAKLETALSIKTRLELEYHVTSRLPIHLHAALESNRWCAFAVATMASGTRLLRSQASTLVKLSLPVCTARPDARCFSILNRPAPKYEGHIPLTRTERLGLALGSGLMSFLDPRRGGGFIQDMS